MPGILVIYFAKTTGGVQSMPGPTASLDSCFMCNMVSSVALDIMH